jgi:hypothetical protein
MTTKEAAEKGRKPDEAELRPLPGGPSGASYWSRFFFLWVNPLVDLAARQTLVKEQLWDIDDKLKVTKNSKTSPLIPPNRGFHRNPDPTQPPLQPHRNHPSRH